MAYRPSSDGQVHVQPSQLPDGNDQQTDQRPDIVPGVPLYLPGGGKNGLPWINPNAFQAPPQNLDPNAAPGAVTRFGNAGNGIVRALNSWQVDMALVKETKLTERFALEFGVQASNVFNHVQRGDPSTLKLDYVPNPNGPGYITQAGSGIRVMNVNNNNDNAARRQTQVRDCPAVAIHAAGEVLGVLL
jgi:hypothetical protein